MEVIIPDHGSGSLSFDKIEKYDRQLRLWGADGQTALSSSKVLIFGAGSLGVEVLKNLILPGLQSFAIVDETIVTERDLGNNYFIHPNGIGKKRSDAVLNALLELNPDEVRGEAVHSFEVFDTGFKISGSPRREDLAQFLNEYSIVVDTFLPSKLKRLVAVELWDMNIPFVDVTVVGLIGRLTTYTRNAYVSNTHADPFLYDLRLGNPFPELVAWMNEKYPEDLRTLSELEQRHVPFVVLLMRAVSQWRQAHDGRYPQTRAEKLEVNSALKSLLVYQDGENVTDGLRPVYLAAACAPYEIPSSVTSLLEAASRNLRGKNRRFWLIVLAISNFCKAHNGVLPLDGIVPDLTAFTEIYLMLCNVYRAKAESDYQDVLRRLRQICANEDEFEFLFSDVSVVRSICKQVRYISGVSTVSFVEEKDDKNGLARKVAERLAKDSSDPSIWYLALEIAEMARAMSGKELGVQGVEADLLWVKNAKRRVSENLQFNLDLISRLEDCLAELVRFGSSKIHNICALMGGIAAQEIIKLITTQWVPISSVFIYDGIVGSSTVIPL